MASSETIDETMMKVMPETVSPESRPDHRPAGPRLSRRVHRHLRGAAGLESAEDVSLDSARIRRMVGPGAGQFAAVVDRPRVLGWSDRRQGGAQRGGVQCGDHP